MDPPSENKHNADWIPTDCREPRVALADGYFPNYPETFEDYIEESWLPQAAPSWNRNTGSVAGPEAGPENVRETGIGHEHHWAHDSFEIPKQVDLPRPDHGLVLYTEFGYILPELDNSPTLSAEYEVASSSSERQIPYQNSNDSHILPDIHPECSPDYQYQTPHPSYHQQASSIYETPFLLANAYTHPQEFVFLPKHHQPILPTVSAAPLNPTPGVGITSSSPTQSSPGLILDWSTCDQNSVSARNTGESSVIISGPKRKVSYDAPVVTTGPTNGWIDLSPKDMTECVDVFENAPGALANVKRRRKLDAPVRKAAREVRKAGACHQCRFRKRTCSTGTPCASCLKNGNGLHELKCQRESPFIRNDIHQYFAHSSTRRVVNFDIKVKLGTFAEEIITIDGIGKISHPLQLKARRGLLNSFDVELQDIIKQTADPKTKRSDETDLSLLLLEDVDNLGTQVEQWAVEYTSKFIHAAGPSFYSTTIAHILGEAYVQKGLPESDLVANMIRVASVAFVLRAGVKPSFTSSGISSNFRTIEAKVDTILYQRLKLAERDLMAKLQKLIFRSAGCLTREQVYPVGLVLWQLLRFLCVSSSHLSNLAERFTSKSEEQAGYQTHTLKLVLSTHLALFRSSNPLLLDVSDKFNQDLVGSDKHLIHLGGKMREVIMKMKEKGFPDMKGSITFKKENFDLFRKVYDVK